MGKNTENAKKLQEVITAKTMESLNKEGSKKTTTKKASKADPKKKTTSEDAIIVKPLKDKKSKKAEAPVPAPKKEKKAPKKESTPRELKYTYPADCKDSLAKKKFRANCRATIKSYNKQLEELKEGSKEYKKVMADFNKFKGEIGLRA